MDSRLSSHGHPSFPPGSFANQSVRPPPAAFPGHASQQQGHGPPNSMYPHANDGSDMMAGNPSLLAQQQYLQRQQNIYSGSAFPPQIPNSNTPAVTQSQQQQYNGAISGQRRNQPFPGQQQQNFTGQFAPTPGGSQAPQMNTIQQTVQPQTQMQVTAAAQPGVVARNNGAPAVGTAGATAAKDQEKVTLLLTINTLLLQETITLQSNGKGGVIGPPAPPKEDDGAVKAEAASKEYLDCMRCLQSNLAYLAQLSPQKPAPAPSAPGPAIMDAPPHVPQAVRDAYEKLKPLFPGWRGSMKAGAPGQGGGARQVLGQQMQAQTAQVAS